MKIVHPTDFSPCAEDARALAVRLARALGGDLILVHVTVDTPLFREGLMPMRELEHFFEEQRTWVRETLEGRAADCRGQGVHTLARVVAGVTPYQGIVDTARQEGADFIVMGTHGRGGLERLFVGSVADRVIRTAPCPVVTTREAGGAIEGPQPPTLGATGTPSS